ncbi:hypothetical protein SCLCIDRAFT_119429 [Scleroderma citrinum Foug A]|uniref:Uncharacterized protein n=1 Tax=Scleroderma citrinum Foug A TaxID=1036808 RepID=A0A0C3E1V7_9AGAM|nr:hypothetical protein SCLCIDRAFT_119429 [Scleroderma citrinum Foug A]
MGERERGKPGAPSTSASQPLILRKAPGVALQLAVNAVPAAPEPHNPMTHGNRPAVPQGYAASWRQVIWEKWRWGVLIALAVIVSKITTTY